VKAVVFDRHGGLEVLQYRDVPDPQIAADEVLVRVRACALNHLDIWVRQGTPGITVPLPHITGSEIAGDVAAVGAGVKRVKVGDRVLISPGWNCGECEFCHVGDESQCLHFKIVGAQVNGGYAELAKSPERYIIPIPGDLSYEEIAAVPLVFTTAWHMLITRARLRAGESVLVLAAGSGIGSAAVQVAKLAGARVFATASSDETLERAKELGADVLINYSSANFAEEVLHHTDKRGVDVVFEHVGPATFHLSLQSLKRGGRLVTCGATTGPKAEFDIRYLFAKQLSIIGSMMGTRAELLTILDLVAQRRLKPVIDKILPLCQAAEAQRLMMERNHFGKLLLRP
jgi:NADPH:quinone reductase-like Zn-dependent oxidoreductase